MARGGERPFYAGNLSKKRQKLTSKSFRIVADLRHRNGFRLTGAEFAALDPKPNGAARDAAKARAAHAAAIAVAPAALSEPAKGEAGAA
jgi:hypothetical protein